MRTSERVRSSRFPVESGALTPVASPADVARRGTATDAAQRIVFVICVLAVAARFIFINQPYVDHWSWRQSDVAAIARNFLQNGFRFGYPQIDWAGNAPGYVGTEFPILPFIAAVCYKFAGVHEWVGRIQAVILFAVSLPFFFLLVREIFGSTAAVWASFFYCFTPLNVFAGRSFMPDVRRLASRLSGCIFFCGGSSMVNPRLLRSDNCDFAVVPHQDHEHRYRRATRLRCCRRLCQPRTLSGFTVKRPTIYRALAIFSVIALLPSAIWYWHAYQIAQNFYPHHFFGPADSIESFSSVLTNCATDPDIEPNAASFTHGADRVACCAANEIRAIFSLVAGCDGSFRHRPRLRQSPSVVSTPARTDYRRVCRRRLRLCRLENFFACHRGDFVDSAHEFVRNPCVLVRATVLPIICGATSQCRFGVEKSDTAGCVDRGRGYGRSDHLLLCRTPRLAFSRDRRDLQRQPERQRAGTRES